MAGGEHPVTPSLAPKGNRSSAAASVSVKQKAARETEHARRRACPASTPSSSPSSLTSPRGLVARPSVRDFFTRSWPRSHVPPGSWSWAGETDEDAGLGGGGRSRGAARHGRRARVAPGGSGDDQRRAGRVRRGGVVLPARRPGSLARVMEVTFFKSTSAYFIRREVITNK
jgi:hypothetical protein